MNEQAKIDEARYFLLQLSATINQRERFNNNVSAFLSAARSALQYAYKEASAKPGGQRWYEGQVTTQPVVKFFKDKRDINIHEHPVKPSATIAMAVSDRLFIHESLSATILHKDGTTEVAVSQPEPHAPPEAEASSSVEYQYVFQDWPGTEDVITLCKMYINDVKAIVTDGQAKGHLS